MSNAVFYHAGCPVCVDAGKMVADAIDARRYKLEIVNFAGGAKNRIGEAEKAGVKSVPALVIDGTVFHINFGASMDDVKKAAA